MRLGGELGLKVKLIFMLPCIRMEKKSIFSLENVYKEENWHDQCRNDSIY